MPIIPRPNILKHLNTTIYDDLGAVSIYGSPVISSVQQRFIGENSLYVSTGNTMTFVNDSSFSFGTGDFTISWSEYLTSATSNGASLIVSNGNTTSGYAGVLFGYNSGANRYLYLSSNGSSWDIANALSLGTIASCLNAWVDWELSRKDNTFYVFKNGVLIQTFTSSLPVYYNKDWYSWYGIYLNVAWLGSAYICEFLVTKQCLHTASFTPNTEPYTFTMSPINGMEVNQINLSDTRNSNHSGSIMTASEPIGDKVTSYHRGISMQGYNAGDRATAAKYGTFFSKDKFVTRNQNIRGCHLIKPKIMSRQKQPLQVTEIAKMSNGDLTNRNLIGTSFKTTNVTKNIVPRRVIISKTSYGNRSKNVSGFDTRAFQVDSNVGNKFNVIITPTHQYKTQQIRVDVSSIMPSSGKWRFTMGSHDIEIIPFSAHQDFSNLSFSVPIDTLAFGDNNCKLYLDYENGIIEYVPLILTKEKFKRRQVYRTFRNYDGGYIINNLTMGNLYSYANLPDMQSIAYTFNGNGTFTTTDATAIPTPNYLGMVGSTFNGLGCYILISFDKRNTWYAWNGTSWGVVNPNDITTSGMNIQTYNALTTEQWMEIFQPTQLDFMVYMDIFKVLSSGVSAGIIKALNNSPYQGAHGSTTPYYSTFDASQYFLTKIDYSANSWSSALSIYNPNYTNIWNGNTVSTHTYTITPYNVISKVENLVTLPGSDYSQSGSLLANLWGVPAVAYCSGISIMLTDDLPPAISNIALSPSAIHKQTSVLSGLITDSESDTVQYRVTVNGTIEVIPWTDFIQTPISLNIPISYDTEKVGTNLITIDAYDGEKSVTYSTYLTVTNDNPKITGILTGVRLTASIGDSDNDTVKYRILFNGVLQEDWTDFRPSPQTLYYKIRRKDIVIGKQNSLVVEVQDDMGGTGSCTFDFVGVPIRRKYAFIM
jgi:hypothetical protein